MCSLNLTSHYEKEKHNNSEGIIAHVKKWKEMKRIWPSKTDLYSRCIGSDENHEEKRDNSTSNKKLKFLVRWLFFD